jgi:DNA-directed RNA polymerase I subunit RPA1
MRCDLISAGLFYQSRHLADHPDFFNSNVADLLFPKKKKNEKKKQKNDSDDDEEDEDIDTTSLELELKAHIQLSTEEKKLVEQKVRGVILTEAKRCGYKESQLDQFYASVAADFHAPVYHERSTLIKEFFEGIVNSPCSCHGVGFKWVVQGSGKSDQLFCMAGAAIKKEVKTDIPLALQRIVTAISNTVNLVPHEQQNSVYKAYANQYTMMLPHEVYEFVKRVWAANEDILQRIYHLAGGDKPSPDQFFMVVVPVLPNKFRPPISRAGSQYENDLNTVLKALISANTAVETEMQKHTADEIPDVVISLLSQIQQSVNDLYDFTERSAQLSKKLIFGYKQHLEKKEGLFRSNLMGKRVNYTARSVILPDPMITTSEVNVPVIFAKKLTFPEVVNDYNINKMRQLILNGPHHYPGANSIKLDGQTYNFEHMPEFKRKGLAKVLKKGVSVVNRHIQDGDMFLVNRQPSLHRVSMMAHSARIVCNQRTIRIHYANCKSYNADFDGDEMNLHIPQDYVAQSEARILVRNANQYCSATSGEPLRGLIQDHIVSGVLLTLKDSFFDQETYYSLVYGSIFHRVRTRRIQTLPPAIIKPKPLWTGKQIVSTILKDVAEGRVGINLDCDCKLKNCWGGHNEENKVIIRDNEVLTGVFDKNQIGATEYGIVHAFDEVYGHDASAELLTCMTRLCTLYLQYHGFTCGIDDLLVTDGCNNVRDEIMKAADIQHRHATAKFAKQPVEESAADYDQSAIAKSLGHALIVDKNRRRLDAEVKQGLQKATTELIQKSIPSGLIKEFPQNCMTMMTQSGAKGSLVNASQISCCLGLQEFEGRRVKPSISGRTLPSFEPYDTSAMAGGYVASRFLSGIKPQEYYFHCMAGRDGLIDTAVKTARSGYLQRCLIKNLEDISVKYDGTIRNLSNSVVQFKYGGDGIDTMKVSFLHNHKFAAMNHKAIVNKYHIDPEEYSEHTDKNILKYKGSDPVISVFDPYRTRGAVSEQFRKTLSTYVTTNPDSNIIIDTDDKKKKKQQKNKKYRSELDVPLDKFKRLTHERYQRSVIEPGEPVGVIAGQSIGEPSTQMTLNTFHFAGLDMAHVTVGIPRLVELLMNGTTASTVTTVPVLAQHNKSEDLVKKFANSISSVLFSDVVESIDTEEQFKMEEGVLRRYVSLTINFDMNEVKEYYCIAESAFWQCVEKSLLVAITKVATTGRIGQSAGSKSAGAQLMKEMRTTTFENIEDMDMDTAAANIVTASDEKKKKRSEDDDEDNDSDNESSTDEEEEDEKSEEDKMEDAPAKTKTTKKKVSKKTTKKTEPSKKISLDHLKKYTVNREKAQIQVQFANMQDKRLFLKQLVAGVCSKVYVRQYEGIQKVNVIPKKPDGFDLQMEGFTLNELLSLKQTSDYVDFNGVMTNDVTLVSQVYGIEAAYRLIVNEMRHVFKMYGITVDERHIALIADYMCQSGSYKACNRRYMATNPGIFHKATFESAMVFLTDCTQLGEIDNLKDPSSQLIFGKNVNQGSGCFDIVFPFQEQ